MKSEHMRYVNGGGDCTQILYNCKCGKSKVETINGHWAFEDLKK